MRRSPEAIAIVAALAPVAAAMLLGACSARKEPPRPDVVIVTIDRIRWEDLAPWGGPVQAPQLASLMESSARFENAVTPAPGGAPAALSVLTGLPPEKHAVRLSDAGRIAPSAQSIADRLGAQGWATGAFLQTDEVTLDMQADRGFGAWDGPTPGFPTGLAAAAQRRDLEDAAASGIHWLIRVPEDRPGLLWLHLAEPAAPGLPAEIRAQRLGELDRVLGAVIAAAERRGDGRGIEPILIICNLSSHGADPAVADREAFLLDEAALRVKVLARGPGLKAGSIAGLAGLDEVAPLAEALALQGDSRLAALASGGDVEPRRFVIAETTLPPACCGAEPRKAAVALPGDSSSDAGAAVAASIAADAGWPGGFGAKQPEDLLAAFEQVNQAWLLAARGRRDEALAAFSAAAAPADAPAAARVGLGLALIDARRPEEARAQFELLRAQAQAGTLAWTQARLGLALAARSLGDLAAARAAIQELLAASPGDLRALTWLADTAAAGGDREGAVAAVRALLERDADNPFALAELGRLEMSAGRPRQAADALTGALARRPTHPGLLLATAEALAAAGDWWSAMDRISERVTLYGETPETLLLTARCWRDTGRWIQAEAAFRKLVEVQPQDPRGHLGLAEALLFQGKDAEGRAAWARARELAPSEPFACEVLRRWAGAAGRDVAAEMAASGCGG